MTKPGFTIKIDTGLNRAINGVARAINTLTTLLGDRMSEELITEVREALANFSNAEANEDAQAAAAAELAAATIASLNEQIAELQAGNQANVDALIEVRDGLIALTPAPAPTPDPEPPVEPDEG